MRNVLCHSQPEKDIVQSMDSSSMSSPLIDAERTLGTLLGLHAAEQVRSTPLAAEEVECGDWLQADFFCGGLQVLQPHNSFDEEKGETRSPSTNTPGEAWPRLRVVLCVQLQPVLQGWVLLVVLFVLVLLISGLDSVVVVVFASSAFCCWFGFCCCWICMCVCVCFYLFHDGVGTV